MKDKIIVIVVHRYFKRQFVLISTFSENVTFRDKAGSTSQAASNCCPSNTFVLVIKTTLPTLDIWKIMFLKIYHIIVVKF